MGGEGRVCCLMDSKCVLLYVVITKSLNFPETKAYDLLKELYAEVDLMAKAGLDIDTCDEAQFCTRENNRIVKKINNVVAAKESDDVVAEYKVPDYKQSV